MNETKNCRGCGKIMADHYSGFISSEYRGLKWDTMPNNPICSQCSNHTECDHCKPLLLTIFNSNSPNFYIYDEEKFIEILTQPYENILTKSELAKFHSFPPAVKMYCLKKFNETVKIESIADGWLVFHQK